MKIDDYNTSILYASLYRHGIYVSMDGGEYWTQIGLSDYTTFDVNVRGVAPMAQANRITADGSASLTIPSATVLAGTASGMYQYSTAGTGVLTGMITAQETNLPIDSAEVSAASGSTCISSQGYYLMLLPSGVHTLDIDAVGYEHATLAGITVQSGQSISRDISLTPRSDDSSCVASSLLRGSKNATSLDVLRGFRDRMLRRSATGNLMIALYYAAGQDVLRALHEHPLLKKRCMQLIDKSIPVIATSLGKKSLTIPSSLLNEVSSFLFDLERVSPADLKAKISRLRRDLKQDGFFNTF
jgi:hypothetical protein